ncbi:EscU/YscU/HrcU family type III secretion system export apparatus switch protein [Shigella flexneri]
MSRQDIRDEFKQAKVTLMLKADRQMQRAAARRRMMADVPKAECHAITRPTIR